MNIYDYMYESNGIWYFNESTSLTVADIDQDQIFKGEKQEVFDKGTSVEPLPVLIFPDAKPNPLPNEVFRWDGEKYYIDYDYRGQVFYEKATGNEVTITELGALPETLTAQKYPGEFYYWDEKQNSWILNEQEKADYIKRSNYNKRGDLLRLASKSIEEIEKEREIFGDDPDLTRRYTSWKTFIEELKLLTDMTQEEINWPKPPEF